MITVSDLFLADREKKQQSPRIGTNLTKATTTFLHSSSSNNKRAFPALKKLLRNFQMVKRRLRNPKMSWTVHNCPRTVYECPKMFLDAPRCPRMDQNVRECPEMSQHVKQNDYLSMNQQTCITFAPPISSHKHS